MCMRVEAILRVMYRVISLDGNTRCITCNHYLQYKVTRNALSNIARWHTRCITRNHYLPYKVTRNVSSNIARWKHSIHHA